KKIVPGITRALLDVIRPFKSIASSYELKVGFFREFPHEFFIGIAFSAAKFVVEMSNDDIEIELFSFFQIDQSKQQSSRIRSAGNRNNDGLVSERHTEPPPFCDQISDELVHRDL